MADVYVEQRIVILDSDNAVKNNGDFNSDVVFNFTGILTDESDIKEVQVSVQNAQIPMSFYNINVYNNILRITYNSTNYTITLTRGNYNSNTLITEIVSQLAGQLITDITITISSVTGILKFVRAGSLNFTILSTGTINKTLGFIIGTNYTTIAGILSAPYPLNLLGILKLKITSLEISTYNFDSSVLGNLNVLATIPIEAGTFGLIQYDNFANIQSIIKNPTLDSFDLQIYGDDGNLVNFNGIEWNIVLMFAITRERKQKSSTQFKDIVQPIMNMIDLQTQILQNDNPQLAQDIQQTQDTQPLGDNQPENTDETDLELLFYNNHSIL
jgi:hypothetical protein